MADPENEVGSSVEFIRAEAQLLVSQLERSLSFFRDVLGFEVKFSFGEPAFYAQVARGNAHLNLRSTSNPPFEREAVRGEGFLSATLCVQDINAIYREFQKKGIDFLQELRAEPWGAKTSIVGDPDGNLILFAE